MEEVIRRDDMEVGITGKQTITVTEDKTAR